MRFILPPLKFDSLSHVPRDHHLVLHSGSPAGTDPASAERKSYLLISFLFHPAWGQDSLRHFYKLLSIVAAGFSVTAGRGSLGQGLWWQQE
jgi:hypothetical protein